MTFRLRVQEEKAALLFEEKEAISDHAQQLQASIKVILVIISTRNLKPSEISFKLSAVVLNVLNIS